MADGLDEDEAAQSTSDAAPEKASWASEKVGPGTLVATLGSTSVSVIRAASDGQRGERALEPERLLVMAEPAASRQRPTTPLQMIMTAANTVSRGRPAFSGSARQHDRDDQRHLDDRHRHRQHERAERLRPRGGR